MTLLCSLSTAIGCSAPPSAYDVGYKPSTALRAPVSQAIQTTNDLLSASNEPIRLLADWETPPTTRTSTDLTYLTVYLVRSDISANRRAVALRIIDQMIAQNLDAEVIADPAYEHCTDHDDCVERLYPLPPNVDVPISTLSIQTLENIASGELAQFAPRCECLILFDFDLVRYHRVLGYAWDAYFLANLFESEDELRTAAESGRVPSILLDGKGLSLHAILPMLLLHEVGHFRHEFAFPDTVWRSAVAKQMFDETLNETKREEVRADAYAGDVFNRGCFNRKLSEQTVEACYGAATISANMELLTLFGKSKEARCHRFFDHSDRYPNIMLRFKIMNQVLIPDSDSGYQNLTDYLDTRSILAEKSWMKTEAICADHYGHTYD